MKSRTSFSNPGFVVFLVLDRNPILLVGLARNTASYGALRHLFLKRYSRMSLLQGVKSVAALVMPPLLSLKKYA